MESVCSLPPIQEAVAKSPAIMSSSNDENNNNNNSNSSGSSNDKALLVDDQFKYYPSGVPVRALLYSNRLDILSINVSAARDSFSRHNVVTWHLADIVGVDIAKSSRQHTRNGSTNSANGDSGNTARREPLSDKAYLTVYAYARNTSSSSSSNGGSGTSVDPSWASRPRKRFVVELECSRYATLDENLAHVSAWQAAIARQLAAENLRRYTVHNSGLADADAAVSSLLYADKLDKPFLLLVNPRSGASKAKAIYYEHLRSVFAEAKHTHTCVFTRNSLGCFSPTQFRIRSLPF